MPSYRIIFTLLLVALATQFAFAQPAQRVIIVNGGQFGNPLEAANVVLYDPVAATYTSLDTIHTGSAQDVLTEANAYAYVAAQDSIVKYDLLNEKRLAAGAFGAPSTIHMELYGNFLLVGNWYAASDHNLRIFNKNTLEVVDSVAGIVHGAKDFVVVGDTAYVTQNLQTSAFTDSAGYISVVDLTDFTHVRDVAFANNDEDLGRLVVEGNTIYGLNPVSNTISTYDIQTGATNTTDAGVDIQIRGNGPQVMQHGGAAFFSYDGSVGSWDLATGSPITPGIVDTTVTSLAMDTVDGNFYLTQTDFFSYTLGKIYDAQGNLTGPLTVGFSPEAIAWTLLSPAISIEDDFPADWKLYPNPASEQLFVEINKPGAYEVAILDMLGKVITTKKANQDQIPMNVSTMTPGVYVIRITSDDQTWVEKFIKK